MLHFFRRYQKAFFIFITTIIVLSFSFFGTYGAINKMNGPEKEQVAFVTSSGTSISERQLEEMTLFLSTDLQDAVVWSVPLGFNVLNDGVITQEILASGIGNIIVESYPYALEGIYGNKEKNFNPYRHPEVSFISAETVWNFFAPQLKSAWDQFKASRSLKGEDVFNAKVNLYLAEKQFPAPMLYRVLKLQQQQNNWVRPDPLLENRDLSMFGYHTLRDWFGLPFIRLSAAFIIDSADRAEKAGYTITKEEALSDLWQRGAEAFEVLKKNPQMSFSNASDYFSAVLRSQGMDQSTAVKLWRQVLLFKVLYADNASAQIVAPQEFTPYAEYLNRSAVLTRISVPDQLRLSGFKDLERYESYIDAVSPFETRGVLGFPKEFFTVDAVKKNNPELVQKDYLVEVKVFDIGSLESRIPLRQVWDWQVDDTHWEELKKESPLIAAKPANTMDERFALLETLDPATRAQLDTFAKRKIVSANSGWLQKALDDASIETKTLSLSPKMAKAPLKGLPDTNDLIQKLESAGSDPVRINQGTDYTYEMRLVEKPQGWKILTYAEAVQNGAIDLTLNKNLQKSYEDLKVSNPKTYQNSDGTFKPLEDVKDEVGKARFTRVIERLQQLYPEAKTLDLLAARRFAWNLGQIKDRLQTGDVTVDEITTVGGDSKPLVDQFVLKKDVMTLLATDEPAKTALTLSEALAVDVNTWSPVKTLPNGDVYFFRRESAVTSQEASQNLIRKVRLARGGLVKKALADQQIASLKQAHQLEPKPSAQSRE